MARKLARKCSTGSGRATQDAEQDDRPNGDADENESTAGGLLNRRDYVKLSAAATGAVLASSGLGSASEERFGIEFDRVVNAVDDLGMDPTGSESIDSALSGAHETGTLIEFPPGDYRVENELVIGPGASESRFGMVGLGDSHTDVQFHFPNGDKEYDGYWFIHQDGGEDCVLANFSIQMTDDTVTSINVRFDCTDGALIQDVEWLGFVPSASHSYGQLLTCHVPEDSGATTAGVNTIRRVTIGRGGAYLGGHQSRSGTAPGTTYIRVYSDHVGELVVEDAHLVQSGGNALRSSNNDGVVTVKGGLFKNNDLSNLRFQGGNHPEKRSTITGARIVVDHGDVPYPTGGTGFWHGMGINIDSRVGGTDLLIEDCDFVCNEIDISDQTDSKPNGFIRLTGTGTSNPGGVTIRNTNIYNNTRNQTLWFQAPDDGANDPLEVVLENVNVTVDNETQTEGAVCVIDGRDGSRISNSCIHAPNGTIDGIAFENCDDVLVEDSNINVGGEAVDLTNTDGNIRNISHSDSCPLPSQNDSDDGDDDSTDDADDDEQADEGWTSFVIDGFDSDTSGEYEFIVHGEARENTELSRYGTVNTVESIDDDRTRVAGTMWSGVDAFDYDGCIESFAAGPDMRFERDGEEISRDEIVDCDHDVELEHSVWIMGTGTTSTFDFTVDGDLISDPTCEISCEDSISGSSAEDAVTSETAKFQFDGEISDFSLDGDAGVYLDGNQVDPELLGTGEDPVLPNWLTVDGLEDETSYQFSVTGNLYKSPDLGPVEADDVINDGMVIGSVTDDIDGYRFSGDLTMLRVQGTADIQFDEE